MISVKQADVSKLDNSVCPKASTLDSLVLRLLSYYYLFAMMPNLAS